MGGFTAFLAGDFRQTLPIVPRGTRADEVKACIRASNRWPLVKKLYLKKKMGVYLKGDVCAAQFSDLFLKIGNGQYPETEVKITIPPDLALVVSTVDDLITRIYSDVHNLHSKSTEWLCERAILTPKNDQASVINDTLLKSFEGEEYQYKSVCVLTDEAIHYPVEFLNTLNPPGLPSHTLILKVGVPVMLLRNLNPPKLCNLTRLRVKALHKNVVEAIILVFTEKARVKSVYIPRVPLILTAYPFEFKRLQFPR
ncbi:unnamed protein product [Parnassius mnemosyne]|uniref:ATP-dependent DNA helicase n=1 Tax=Parnassius mnemosyne TaxID=213953 RepID=A0AAV1M963_9NEOP